MSGRMRVLLGSSLGFALGIIWARGRSLGRPAEWQSFRKRHPHFIRNVPRLQAIVDRIFADQPSANTLDRQLVFLLGCLCWQDFIEIALLCGNGYGIGAAKLLRGLYEHAVTGHHLAKHPQNAPLFDEYLHVQNKKFLDYAMDSMPAAQLANIFSQPQKDSILQEYDRVSPNYKRRDNTWTPINTRDMALQDGDGLHRFYAACFANPGIHLHASPKGLYSRISRSAGRLMFQSGAQRQEASQTLYLAICVFLLGIRAQILMFSPEDEARLAELTPVLLSDWLPEIEKAPHPEG